MQRIGTNRPLRWYTVAGLIVVPVILATALLVGATPRDADLQRIQGAIVNLDEGAEVNGKKMPLGRMLAAELVDSERAQNYTWVMADTLHADAGLRSGTYAVVVTIPQEFSEQATSYSANDSTAHPAQIQVETSPAAGISDAALGEVVTRVAVEAFNQTITEKYLDNIYVALNSTGEQMASLHDGVNKLADGSSSLSDGLGTMADKGRTLAGGADKLAAGTKELASGLNTMAEKGQQLSTGVGGLSQGTTMLADGLGNMAEQTAALPEKSGDLAAGVGQYVKGTTQVLKQLETLAPKLADLPDTSQLTGLSEGVVTKLSGHAAALDHLSRGETATGGAFPCPDAIRDDFGDDGCAAYLAGVRDAGSRAASSFADSGSVASVRKLDAAVNKLADNLGEITATLTLDPEKLAQLKTAGSRIEEGANGLAGQLGTLAGGIEQLADGAGQLNSGATKISEGVTTYVGGVGTVADNVGQLTSGTRTFANGVGKYTGGVKKVAAGSQKLATGLGKLDQKLADKVPDLPNYTEADRAALSGAIASPITTEDLPTLTLPAAARSAILLALALWLGALVTFVVLRPVRGDTAWSTLSTPRVVARQLLPAMGVGLAQAGALSLLTRLLLDLDSGVWAPLTLLLAVVAVTFMLVVQGVVAWLHAPGRLLILAAAVLAVLSTLTHTVPAWFSGLAATTPLAPANEALRSALAGQPVNGAIFALIGWALLGTALAASAVIKARRLTAREVLSAIPGS